MCFLKSQFMLNVLLSFINSYEHLINFHTNCDINGLLFALTAWWTIGAWYVPRPVTQSIRPRNSEVREFSRSMILDQSLTFIRYRLPIQNLSHEQICGPKAIRESRQAIGQSHRSSSAKKITRNFCHTYSSLFGLKNTFQWWDFKKLNLYRVIVIKTCEQLEMALGWRLII